jgi:hypothetical protein
MKQYDRVALIVMAVVLATAVTLIIVVHAGQQRVASARKAVLVTTATRGHTWHPGTTPTADNLRTYACELLSDAEKLRDAAGGLYNVATFGHASRAADAAAATVDQNAHYYNHLADRMDATSGMHSLMTAGCPR